MVVCGFELCLDWFRVKLNMFVKSFPNYRALERLREATFPENPSLLLTFGIPVEPVVVSTRLLFYEESILV